MAERSRVHNIRPVPAVISQAGIARPSPSMGGNPKMLRVAMKMLLGDRAKYVGLLFGITFTSFLVTFAASYLCGFMTRGFALISENPGADVWVMDPAVESTEQIVNIPDSALDRVRSVNGVRFAVPLALATADARFPNSPPHSLQLI